jgi:hypothetical protein
MPAYNVNNNSTNYDVTDYSDSEYDDIDSEYSEDTQDIIYEAEEPSSTKYVIALCELFNEKIHGNTSSDVKYHYLVNTRFKQLNMNCINEMANFLNNSYIYEGNLHHYIFRNYRNIILNGNYIKPEIVEILYLKADRGFDYCVAIIKTFWLKIIKRAWKNILKKRQEIILRRKQITSLQYRERHGQWPKDCLYYPGLRGMLSNLKF